ncbi:MAG: UDP-N-acetylmuramoyl-L-alanyl-D-glutamate--2,6-diaminopimelate ligase [Pseudomonadota bacterium]
MRVAADRYTPVPMSLPQLLDSTDQALEGVEIRGIELDSRRVGQGDLFVAVPGEVHDGRQFIEQAVANGASAVLAEAPVAGFVEGIPVPLVELPELRFETGYLAAKFYRQPSRDMGVIGVTGTNGKTTTTRLMAQLARALGKPCGVVGTLGATLEDDVVEAPNTTPDALSLQRQLAEWLQRDVLWVAMEVSSHALVQGRVNGVEFDTAVYTNLSHDHLDYHGSMAAYAQAKLRLFRVANLRHAVINADDDYGALIAAGVRAEADIVSYGLHSPDADVRVENVRIRDEGLAARLHSPWGSGDLLSPLLGEFNLSNVLAAVSALAVMGEQLDDLLDGVAALKPVPGRMQSVPNEVGIQIIVDYAHTPDALQQALLAIRPHVDGELLTVFGCGGDRDRAKRQLMGRVACRFSDRVILTSDNPRGEDPLSILQDIEAGCAGDYLRVEDRAQAIRQAVNLAQPGDLVLIAGKGHEAYQIVDGQRLFFSDAAHAREALAERVAS